MDEKEQERCWLEEWIAKDREMEISERLAKFNKMRAFREGLAEQVNLNKSQVQLSKSINLRGPLTYKMKYNKRF